MLSKWQPPSTACNTSRWPVHSLNANTASSIMGASIGKACSCPSFPPTRFAHSLARATYGGTRNCGSAPPRRFRQFCVSSWTDACLALETGRGAPVALGRDDGVSGAEPLRPELVLPRAVLPVLLPSRGEHSGGGTGCRPYLVEHSAGPGEGS